MLPGPLATQKKFLRKFQEEDLPCLEKMRDEWDFGYIIGSLWGDGSISDNCMEVAVTDKCQADQVYESLDAILPGRPRASIRHTHKTSYYFNGKKEKRIETKLPSYRVRISGKHIASYLNRASDFGEVEQRSEKFRLGFLSGLYDSDGYIQRLSRIKRGVKVEILFCADLKRLDLVKTVVRLLFQLGIDAYYAINKNGMYIVYIRGGIYIKRFIEKINFRTSYRRDALFLLWQESLKSLPDCIFGV